MHSKQLPGGIVVHGGFNGIPPLSKDNISVLILRAGIEHLGDSWLLDTATLTWRQLHATSPAAPCSNHCLVVLDSSSLLRIGGEASSHASTALAPPVIIDTRLDGTWALQPIANAPAKPLSDCSAGWITGADGVKQLCLFGGWGEGAAASRCVVVDTRTWSCVEAAVKSAAHVEVSRLGAGALLEEGGRVLLFGGWDGMFQWMNALLAITLF